MIVFNFDSLIGEGELLINTMFTGIEQSRAEGYQKGDIY